MYSFRPQTLIPALALLLTLPLAWPGQAEAPEIKGLIQAMPAGRTGVWRIGGRALSVTAATRLKEKQCKLQAGALAEAEYRAQGQTLVATEIECEQTIEFEGPIQAMPANRIGTWKLAGQSFVSNAQTRFKEKECLLRTGVRAEAEVRAVNKQLVAIEIECDKP